MKDIKRNLFNPLFLITLVGILVYLGMSLLQESPNVMKLTFFDVGQGDAALATTPNGQNILIDGGPDDSIVSKLDKNIPFYSRQIDAVVLTHPHADHVSGLVAVVNKYQITRVYMNGTVHTAPEYLAFLEALKTHEVPVQIVKSGDSLDFGDNIKLDFLFPLSSTENQKVENLNNSSVVTRLSWGKASAIMMGDLESEAQSQLLASGQNVKSDIIKVAHHGSKDSVNAKFLSAVSPKYAVISAGKDNRFGHPSKSALDSLVAQIVYRTDYDGDVVFELTQNGVNKK